jgi:IS5 family transposase
VYHQVVQQQTDDQVTVEMVTQTKKRFPKLNAALGFHTSANQIALKEHLGHAQKGQA